MSILPDGWATKAVEDLLADTLAARLLRPRHIYNCVLYDELRLDGGAEHVLSLWLTKRPETARTLSIVYRYCNLLAVRDAFVAHRTLGAPP